MLAAICERRGLTQTDAVKAAIEEVANAVRPTPAELATRLGLVGAFHSGVGDLGEQHSLRLKQRLRATLRQDSAIPAHAAASRKPGAA
ncbi:hypothetical protein [Piscinibacter sp.]|uniref:hypothetical protein n=1 Tax=Piscinibacter sp. TaxID=1903157 RepID=UPI002B5DD4EB|nr:hypothetical protein [Albitalea sp.]HUG26038.1 hypothetical protein [Albitalea sp.]